MITNLTLVLAQGETDPVQIFNIIKKINVLKNQGWGIDIEQHSVLHPQGVTARVQHINNMYSAQLTSPIQNMSNPILTWDDQVTVTRTENHIAIGVDDILAQLNTLES